MTTTADDGPGSLREAIIDANQSPASPDIIEFHLLAAGPQVISLLSPLPPITDPVNIDATTKLDFVPNKSTSGSDEMETDIEVPMVQIDGSAIDPTAYPKANGLEIDTVNCAVSGLSITGFRGAGIVLNPGPDNNTGAIGNVIEGDFILDFVPHAADAKP